MDWYQSTTASVSLSLAFEVTTESAARVRDALVSNSASVTELKLHFATLSANYMPDGDVSFPSLKRLIVTWGNGPRTCTDQQFVFDDLQRLSRLVNSAPSLVYLNTEEGPDCPVGQYASKHLEEVHANTCHSDVLLLVTGKERTLLANPGRVVHGENPAFPYLRLFKVRTLHVDTSAGAQCAAGADARFTFAHVHFGKASDILAGGDKFRAAAIECLPKLLARPERPRVTADPSHRELNKKLAGSQ